MSADQKKILNEAAKHMKEGDSYMKGGIFRKPKFDDAATEYKNAFDILFKAKIPDRAKEAALKAGEAFDKAGLPSSAADFYNKAADCAFTLKQFNELPDLMNSTRMMFQFGNQALAGIRAVRSMADKMRQVDKEIAYKLYDEALTLVEEENQYTWEKETFLDFACLALDLEKYDNQEVFKAWERAEKAFLALNNSDAAAHCVVAIIAIHLKRGDIVAAGNAFDAAMQKEYFIHTEDFSMIDQVYRGVKNHDGDVLELGQRNFIVQMLKPQIGRIIMGFKAPKSAGDASASAAKGAAAAAPAPEPQEAEEEEDGIDLL